MTKSTPSKPIHDFCGVPLGWSGARERSKVESRSRVPSAMRFQPSSECPLEYKKSRRWFTRRSKRVLCVDITSGKRQAKCKKSKEIFARKIVDKTRGEGVILFSHVRPYAKRTSDRMCPPSGIFNPYRMVRLKRDSPTSSPCCTAVER